MRSLARLVVTNAYPTPGLLLTDQAASSLRALRSEALDVRGAATETEPRSFDVSDCGQDYRMILRDELPRRLHGDFTRFLKAAWDRPVIASCKPSPNEPDVAPCPSDFDE
jgi:hypothetical protein